MNNTSQKTRFRIAADIILILAVLYAPWWLTFGLVFLGIWYFKNFYEAFFLSFLFDILYGANIASLHGFRFVFSLIFLVLIFVVDFLKEKVRV